MARLPSIPDLADKFKGLQRRVKKLETAARLGYSTISRGGLTIEGLGRLLIAAGGSIRSRDGQSRDLFYVGGFQETQPGVPNGYGVAMYRLDGSVAFIFSDDANSEQLQRVKLADRSGRLIFAEDSSGAGLGAPVMHVGAYSNDYTTWGGTDQAGFTQIAGVAYVPIQPRAWLGIKHTADAADTTGELQVFVDGTVVQTLTVSFGIGTNYVGPFAIPAVGEFVDIQVRARRTAGTGRVRATVFYSSQWPSD